MKKKICCILGFFILISSMYADFSGFGDYCPGRDLVTLQTGYFMGGYGNGPVIEAEASFSPFDMFDSFSMYGSYIFSYRFAIKNIPDSAISKLNSVFENIFEIGLSYFMPIGYDFSVEASFGIDMGASEVWKKVNYETFHELNKDSTCVLGFSLGAEVFISRLALNLKMRSLFGDFLDPYDKYGITLREFVPKDCWELGFTLGAGITF